MPDLLVTLCNLQEARETALLGINLQSAAVSEIKIGATVPIKSCTGMAYDATRIYVVCADAEVRSYLSVLDRANLRPLYFHRLPEVIDGHSILVHQGRLFVVSTGNDAIFAYDLAPEGPRNPTLAWNIPDDSGSHHDTHHLNSIALWGGDIVFSAFGSKAGPTWSTATAGYFYSLNQGEIIGSRIYQPHTLKDRGRDLYYCESARGTIANFGKASWEVGGYTRGLEFLDQDTVAVGTSVARKVSKSTGVINNPSDPGEKAGECEVNVYRLHPNSTFDRLRNFSLAEYGTEIYDLLFLQNTHAAQFDVPGMAKREAAG